jgi:hypothetical protein
VLLAVGLGAGRTLALGRASGVGVAVALGDAAPGVDGIRWWVGGSRDPATMSAPVAPA